MKIAVVTPLFPIRAEPFRGQPVYLTVRALARLAQVKVFCPQVHYPPVRALWPRNFVYHPPERNYRPDGVETEYFSYPAIPLAGRLYSGRLCAWRLRPLLHAWRPDLILSYWLYPDGWAAAFVGRELGVPVVVGSRGSDLRERLDSVTLARTQAALRNCDGALMVSEVLRQRAISFGVPPERVRTILNGCDTGVFRPADRAEARRELGVEPDEEVVLFVGHLIAGKGVRELIQAVTLLKERRPRLKAVLVGNGALTEDLPALAGQLGVGKHLRMAGHMGAPEVAKWLAASDVFTLPSYSEGCPNVVIEAMACGRPVVATPVGAIPDLIQDTGLLVAARDEKALAEGLDQALARASTGGWDAAAISARWSRSWDLVAQETLEFCRQTLARRKGAL